MYIKSIGCIQHVYIHRRTVIKFFYGADMLDRFKHTDTGVDPIQWHNESFNALCRYNIYFLLTLISQ